MAKILFLTLEGGGNVPPALLIAGELLRRGHEVCFLGHPQQAAQIEGAGFRFEPYRRARTFSAVAARPGLRSTLAWIPLFTDHGPGRDLDDLLSREGVDLVVIDCLLGGAFASARRSGVPTIMLMHTFIRFWSAQWRGPIGLITKVTRSNPLDAVTASVLLTTLRDLDPIALGAGIAADRVRQVGPVLPPLAAAPKRRATAARPRLLVSLSTISQPGQRELLQRLLDAIAELPVDAIVTTGPAIDPATLRVPPNVTAQRFVAHTEIMPTIDLVVGHGGHGTTMLALAHDLPLLMIPLSPMIDQPMVAAAVQEAGAGVALPMKSSVGQLRDAISGLLSDEGARAAARVLGAQIRSANGAQAAADQIEVLAAESEPAHRRR